MDIELLVKLVTKVILELINSGQMNIALKEGTLKASPKTTHVFSDKKVICMEDLRGIESGFLKISKNTVITPLAKDYVKEKGIEIGFV